MTIATTTRPTHCNTRAILELAGASPMSASSSDGSLLVEGITQEALDDAMAIYNADLETYFWSPKKQARKDKMAKLSAEFIEGRYPSFRRELFIALAEEARNIGLTNRAAYINQMLTWVKTVVATVLTLEDQVNAASTVEEITSVDFDSTPFIATDPEITIRNTLAIED
tara:strand:- start:3714 stop:4220 length:507 start_codon:yes stop_codon:yes gene_type:complete